MAKKICKIWYDEELGIGRFRLSGEVTAEDLEDLLDQYKRITEKHGELNWLDDFSGVKRLKSPAKRISTELMSHFKAKKVAILGRDPFVEILIGFLSLFTSEKPEVRFFSSQDEALAWLKNTVNI